MPLYDYHCISCGPFEASRPMKDSSESVACPQCHAPFLLEKMTKKGTTRKCANEECDYKSEALPAAPTPQTTTRTGSRLAR